MSAWLVQGSLIHGAACALLALIAGAGALAKLTQRSAVGGGNQSIMLVRLSRSPVIVAVQAVACVVLLSPLSAAVHLVAAFGVLIIVVFGQIIRSNSPERTCDCFGSLTPSSGAVFWLLTVLSVLATLDIVLQAYHSPADIAGYSGWIPIATVAVLLVVVAKLRYDDFAAKFFVTKYAPGESPQALPPGLELGRAADGTHVTVANAIDGCVAMIVVALSATCETCHLLYQDIRTFAEQSGGEVRLVLVANHAAVYGTATSSHLHQLIDKDMAIGRYLRMSGTPFAALVNDKFELLALPSVGRDQVRALLNLSLQLLPAEAV